MQHIKMLDYLDMPHDPAEETVCLEQMPPPSIYCIIMWHRKENDVCSTALRCDFSFSSEHHLKFLCASSYIALALHIPF